MENSQINENILKPARSPPSEPRKTPSKRRKLVTENSSSLSPPKKNPPHVNENQQELKRLRTHFRTKLSHIGTSTTQLQNIRKQIGKILEMEAKKLEIEAQVGIETLEQLERHLDIENTPHDPLEHQTPAEVYISPLKTPMKQKLLDLLPENTRLKENLIFSDFGGIPTSPATPCPLENHPEVKKTPEKLSNKIITHRKIESQECMVKIHKLNTEKILWKERETLLAEVARVNDLENKLKSSRDTISTLREALKDKIILEQQLSGLRKTLEHAETREQKLKSMCRELSSRVEDYKSRSSGSLSGSVDKKIKRLQLVESRLTSENGKLRSQVEVLKRENGELRRKFERDEQRKSIMRSVKVELIKDESFSDNQVDVENYSIDVVDDDSIDNKSIERKSAAGVPGEPQGESGEKRKISIGHLGILPSSQSYFDIDFESQYVRENKSTFICCSCEGIYNTKPKIIDHLWSVHHQGQWHCPYCSCTARDRYTIIAHMKKKHGSKISKK